MAIATALIFPDQMRVSLTCEMGDGVRPTRGRRGLILEKADPRRAAPA